VAGQVVDGAGLVLRPLSRADFPMLVDWLARPHVAAWWGTPLDRAGVEKEFGPCVDGTDPTEIFIGLEAGTPVGLVQIFVAEADRRGQGLGPRLITAALDQLWAHYPEVQRAMAGPSARNLRSHRAFEKVGFESVGPVTVPGEPEDELVLVCPRPPGATGATGA
jgi:RimJ/RimL family protein N-acetyltransferase